MWVSLTESCECVSGHLYEEVYGTPFAGAITMLTNCPTFPPELDRFLGSERTPHPSVFTDQLGKVSLRDARIQI